MIDSRVEPVRWLTETTRADLAADRTLFRRDEWVTTFLACVAEYLARVSLPRVHLDSRRSALVLTGRTDTGALRVVDAAYRDILLFHERLHPEVEDVVALAIEDATAELFRRGFVEGDELRRHGRRALIERPGLLLDESVVVGLDALGIRGLPAIGVTGIIEVRSATGDYLMASLRSDRVAVNPGCLAPPVDGGIDRHGGDPRADLERELQDELPWDLGEIVWNELGLLLPQQGGSFVGGERTVRGGANFIFHAVLKADADELLRTAGSHFESDGMVMIETSRRRAPARPLTARAFRHGAVLALDPLPEISEVLAASLARLGVIELSRPLPIHRTDHRHRRPGKPEARHP